MEQNPNTEIPDLTNNAPEATPWGLCREPQWITKLNNAIEPEPEEDPFPLTLHYPDKDNKLKLKGEKSPQTSNDMSDWKETLSLRNDQCDKEILELRNPENKLQGSASDDKEGTTNSSHHQTHQRLMCPTSDDEEGTTTNKLTSLEARVPPWSKNNSATNNATRGRNPHHIHKLSSHSDMTQWWMTQSQNIAHQPEWEQSMMPLLQTSAHYPKTSKQND